MQLHKCFIPYLALAMLLALVAGCAVRNVRPTLEQQSGVDQALAWQRQGRFMDAAHAWQHLADVYDRWQDRYLLNAAEAWRQLDDWQAVAPIVEAIDRDHLNHSQAMHLDLLRAGAALAAQQPATALQLTRGADTLSEPWRLRGLELRARAQAASKKPLAAARSRLMMDPALSGFDRSENQRLLLEYLKGMDVAALQTAADGLPAHDPMRTWIADALEAKGSALAKALPQPQTPVGTLLPAPDHSVRAEGYAAPATVALLLPTVGPLQAAAAAVQDGFTTAWQHHPQQTKTMQLLVLDASGGPDRALGAYRQAVSSGADLVVGPLAPDAVAALFQRAQLPVPILALNRSHQGLPPSGSVAFALPPEAEGAQIAMRMRAHGLDQAVLFLADADWAQRGGRAFRAQFERHGGNVIGSATLAATQVDYSAPIQALMAQANLGTGVFIAMRPRQGRLLVPQLRIAAVIQPLYATSHIYGVETNQGLNRDLDGVIFPDSPWLFGVQSGPLQRSEIAQTDANARGPAARLFAFGMDAFELMPYLDWMRQHPGSYVPGATGDLTIDRFGRVRRTPIWAQFVNGIAVPLTGALQARPAASLD